VSKNRQKEQHAHQAVEVQEAVFPLKELMIRKMKMLLIRYKMQKMLLRMQKKPQNKQK
jgi:hypothetical protein